MGAAPFFCCVRHLRLISTERRTRRPPEEAVHCARVANRVTGHYDAAMCRDRGGGLSKELIVRTSLMTGGVVVIVLAMPALGAAEPAGAPTFTKDVAPILFANCVACHRPNHMAPMSLMSYGDT